MSEPHVPTPLFAHVANNSLTVWNGLSDALLADVKSIFELQQGHPIDQALRRALVRSFWGYIEGSVYGLAQYVETIEDLTDSEHAKRPSDKERTLDEIKLTVKWCTSDRLTPGWSPSFESPGWEAVRDSYIVRNRLMHPKSAESFSVSDSDLKLTHDALLWFIQTISEVRARALIAAQI
jgi:hypothetical protein